MNDLLEKDRRIEELLKEIGLLKKLNERYLTEINDRELDIGHLETQVDDLHDRIEDLEDDVAFLEHQLEDREFLQSLAS